MASDITRILDMINGYQQTCIVVAALQLELFDRLAAEPATTTQLAKAVGADELSLNRLVRALIMLGLVSSESDVLHVTPTGKLLLKNGMGAGMRAWALLVGGEYLGAWGNLRHSVMTGEVAFESVFGTSAWQHRAAHPELDAAFNQVTSGEQKRALAALLRAYDFSGFERIVDVGGGHGNLVAGILTKNPDATGIVFDQPHVVAGAGPSLASAGVATRCDVVGGSFLDAVPAGGDLYMLKHVLHNWRNDDCVRILRHCREAMSPEAKLLVLENILPEDPRADPPLVMLDLHMMAVLGGRERTRAEYEELLGAAGLRCARVIATREGAPDIIEAVI